MKNFLVNVLTPPRLGGPFYWAQNLVKLLNFNGIQSLHKYNYKDLITSPFYQNADIIHAALPLAFKVWKQKLVFTIKGDYLIEKRRWRYMNALTQKTADAITTPSQFLKERLNISDAIIIPNAIFSNDYLPVVHEEKTKINLVTVTNFSFRDKSEGIIKIIEVLEDIKKTTDMEIIYTVVGGGPYLQKVIKKSQNSQLSIKYTGFIPNPSTVLQQSDIFIYHSIHDNFPNVFLEAMASGLPIITNNVGAVAEIIESNESGFIASERDVYFNTLLELISNHNERRRIGNNARKRAEENYDWNRILPQYISLYNTLISK